MEKCDPKEKKGVSDERNVEEKIYCGVAGQSGKWAFTKANAQSVEPDSQTHSGSLPSGFCVSNHDKGNQDVEVVSFEGTNCDLELVLAGKVEFL